MYIYLAQVRENGIGVCGLETLLFFSLSFSLVCSPSPKSLPLLFYFFEAFLRRKTWGKRKFFFCHFSPKEKKVSTSDVTSILPFLCPRSSSKNETRGCSDDTKRDDAFVRENLFFFFFFFFFERYY